MEGRERCWLVVLLVALLAGCGSDGNEVSRVDDAGVDASDGAFADAAEDLPEPDAGCPDGGPPRAFHPDGDGDGFGAMGTEPIVACTAPDDHVDNDDDCDDGSAEARPGGGPEACDDGLDNDCDGLVDYASDACTTLEGCAPPPTFMAPRPADEGIAAEGRVLWLRADLGLSTDPDARVCEWKDLSGSRNHFAQTVAAERPLRVDDEGEPAVESVSGETVLREDALGVDPAAGRTLFVVAAMRAPELRSRTFWQGEIGTPGTYFGPEANTFNSVGSRFGVYLTNNAYDSDVPSSANRTLHTVLLGDLTPGTPILDVVTYRVNRTDTVLTRTRSGLGDGTVESIASFERTWVGAQFGGGTVLREVLLYARALDAEAIAAVEAYLAGRHGLALAD